MTADTGVSSAMFRRLARDIPGVAEAPHFDRIAFRTRRIFTSLAADGTSANLCLTPEEQRHWCDLLPGSLSPLPNKWGARGWTLVRLDRIDPADLAAVLRAAWSRTTEPRGRS